jgi:hypothetical protein
VIPVAKSRIVTSTRARGLVNATTSVCVSSEVRSARHPSTVVTSTTSSALLRRCTVTVPPSVRMVLLSSRVVDEVEDEDDEVEVDDVEETKDDDDERDAISQTLAVASHVPWTSGRSRHERRRSVT